MNPRHLRTVRSLIRLWRKAPIGERGAISVARCVRKLTLAAQTGRSLAVAVLIVAASSARAAEIGTAFSYQGFLEKPADTPVTDTCDFEFTLWDDAEPGAPDNQTRPTLTFAGLEAVAVTDGVFTVVLDFGANAINGQGRWLGIAVCCPSGCALQ